MLSRTILVLLLAAVGAAQTCTPSFIGEYRNFVVENGRDKYIVPALIGDEASVRFFDSTAKGLADQGTSVLFLYRDLTDRSGKLDLFWVSRKDEDAEGAEADVMVNGLPVGVSSDDFTINGRRAVRKWEFDNEVVGGVITGLERTESWVLRVRAKFENVTTFKLLFGEGTEIELDPRRTTHIRPIPVGTFNQQPVFLYPQEVGTRITYCAMATDGSGEMEYTFSWGDGTGNNVVRRPRGKAACAMHVFCGKIGGGCGGSYPRAVRVSVKSARGSCSNSRPRQHLLATEKDVFFSGTAVVAEGIPVEAIIGSTPLRLHRTPSQFAGMKVFTPTGGVGNGALVRLECEGNGNDLAHCSFVVSTYHCPPCTADVNGGYPASMPEAGFIPGSCAPRFGPRSNKMTSFFVTVPPGGNVVLPATTTRAPFLAIYGRKGFLDGWCPPAPPLRCGGPCPKTTCVCSEQ